MKNIRKLFLLVVVLTATTTLSVAQQGKPILNHIAIYVKNLKISTDFYTNVIDLDTIPEPFHDKKHTWFSIGEFSHLHVIEGAKEITDHEKNSHLCFSVP